MRDGWRKIGGSSRLRRQVLSLKRGPVRQAGAAHGPNGDRAALAAACRPLLTKQPDVDAVLLITVPLNHLRGWHSIS